MRIYISIYIYLYIYPCVCVVLVSFGDFLQNFFFCILFDLFRILKIFPKVLENSPQLLDSFGDFSKTCSFSTLALFLRVLENSPKFFVFFSFQFMFLNFKNLSKVLENSPKLSQRFGEFSKTPG